MAKAKGELAAGRRPAYALLMDRETAAFYDSIVKSLDRIVGCVGGLSFDEVNSRLAGPTSNSLYAIATHALANAERNVLSTYCGEAYTWNRDAEFAARGESSGALEANWRLLRERMRVALEAARPEALLEERDHPHMGRVAGRAVLLRAAVHAAGHAGEADLTRALVVNAAPRSITSADSGSAFVVGVDGCRAGWVAAAIDLTRSTLDLRVFPTFESVLQEFGGARCITVDIPIGLTDGPRRECDILARAALGARRSSVFSSPCRQVLSCPDYPSANAASRNVSGRGLSAQAFGIVPKIREVDELMTPVLQDRVREVHPEVCFAALAGAPMAFPKRDPSGFDARRAALQKALPHIVIPDRVQAGRICRGTEPDDILDAVVAAWSALRVVRGEATILGGAVDSRGLRMEMVC